MIRYIFFDTEFTGLEKNTDLISIGLIADDGSSFYYEFSDYNPNNVNQWIKDYVINHLFYNSYKEYNIPDNNNEPINYRKFRAKGSFEQGRVLLNKWLGQFKKDEIQFVSDINHYDFVLLIDLISGHALTLPENISPVCVELNSLIADYHKVSDRDAFDISRELILNNNGIWIAGAKHNLLYDAKVIKSIFDILGGKESWI